MSDGEKALQTALADACLGESSGDAIATDLRAFLEARAVPAEDVTAILAAPRRIAVYRALVRNGVSSIVACLMPRTRARMNAICAGRFDADLARFLDEVAPRTHYLRDVPTELFAWARPQWEGDPSVPRYVLDLAAHELICFAVGSADVAQPPDALGEIDPTQPLVFAPSMRLVRYAWAVHDLPDDVNALAEPARRDVCLLGYRDPSHATRWLELTPLAAAIVDRLAAGDPLGVGLARACAERGATADVGDVARLLADLAARGVVLGGGAR